MMRGSFFFVTNSANFSASLSKRSSSCFSSCWGAAALSSMARLSKRSTATLWASRRLTCLRTISPDFWSNMKSPLTILSSTAPRLASTIFFKRADICMFSWSLMSSTVFFHHSVVFHTRRVISGIASTLLVRAKLPRSNQDWTASIFCLSLQEWLEPVLKARFFGLRFLAAGLSERAIVVSSRKQASFVMPYT